MKNVIRVIVVLIVALLLFIQTRPDRFHVERSIAINAPAEMVFAQVNDFHKWAAWSPWEKLDPQMHRTFDGPASGVGASYHWLGNNKVGEGSMVVVGATPSSQAVIDLEFIKPFKSSNVTTFNLAPEGAGTRVTWIMEGKCNFEAKAMGVFASMDEMIGPDFERGLASLKGAAESAPAAATPAAGDTTAPAAPTGMSAR